MLKISQLTELKGTWRRWDGQDGQWFELLIKPKSGAFDKKLQSRTISTRSGRRGQVEVETDHELRVQMLVKECVEDWRGATDDNGNDVPYDRKRCFEVLWKGPSELLDWFDAECETVTREAEEGNASASTD